MLWPYQQSVKEGGPPWALPLPVELGPLVDSGRGEVIVSSCKIVHR